MPKKEPLLTTPLPDYPWQMVRSDLFEISGEHYLLVMDYFSRLTSTTSAAIITSLKSIYVRHGILEVLRSDNGPQYAYLVMMKTLTGTVRRNHIHLNVNPSQPSEHLETQTETEKNTDSQATRRIVTRSQTGTMVKPPKRLCA